MWWQVGWYGDAVREHTTVRHCLTRDTRSGEVRDCATSLFRVLPSLRFFGCPVVVVVCVVLADVAGPCVVRFGDWKGCLCLALCRRL